MASRSILPLALLLFTSVDPAGALSSPSAAVTKTVNAKAAVIVPGFLTGESDFRPLAAKLTERGIPTAVVPMPSWHWIPCIGGRSIRPILERVDYTVRHVSALLGSSSESGISVPSFDYSPVDCLLDFRDNPGGIKKVGGSDVVDEYPHVVPRGNFPPPPDEPNARIALIGHSAGGFISRAYLSERSYGGKAFGGQRLVHSLLTLGTPHGEAPGAPFETVKWCNREEPPVRCLAVGGIGTPGDRSGDLTKGAYGFCHGVTDGSSYDGDGLTTIDSALALEGENVKKLTLEGVTHYPWSDAWIWGDILAPDLAKHHREGKPWYGDDEIVDRWIDFLTEVP